MKEQIKVIVHPDGTFQMESKNFGGAKCDEQAKKLMAKVGGEAKEWKKTADYNKTSEVHLTSNR